MVPSAEEPHPIEASCMKQAAGFVGRTPSGGSIVGRFGLGFVQLQQKREAVVC